MARGSTTLIRQEPTTKNLLLYRGDTFSLRVDVKDPDGNPLDISLATWDADIRLTPTTTAVFDSFTVVPVEGDVTAVDCQLTADQVKLFPETLYWDLEMTLNDWVTTLLAGKITVRVDVSRVEDTP